MQNIKKVDFIGNLEEDMDWFIKNYETISKKYAGKAIAIYNKTIIAVGKNYIKFLEELKARKIDPTKIIIETIPEEDASYIL